MTSDISGESEAGLVRLPTAIPSPMRDLRLVTYPDLYGSPAIRAVMDYVADVVGQSCPLRDSADTTA